MLLQTNDVSKRFPMGRGAFGTTDKFVHALDGVNLSIAKGRTMALVGESGSGKTTLGRVCAGLLEPTEGVARFNGQNLARLSEDEKRKLRTRLQFVFQDPFSSLNPRHDVKTILSRPFEVHTDLSKDEIERKVLRLLQSVNLTPPEALLGCYPHQFSGGQRQRIVFARAIALRPEFVIADEPVSSLDMSVKAQLLTLLRRFQNELDLTYLFITHELSVVRSIAQDVSVMYLGRIVETAPVTELFENPLHPYTNALLAATPQLVPREARETERKRSPLRGTMPSPIDPPPGCHFHTRCPFAQPVCEEKAPSLRKLGARQVACHFVGDDRFPLSRNLSPEFKPTAAQSAEAYRPPQLVSELP